MLKLFINDIGFTLLFVSLNWTMFLCVCECLLYLSMKSDFANIICPLILLEISKRTHTDVNVRVMLH